MMNTLKLIEHDLVKSMVIPFPSEFLLQFMPKAHPLYNMVYIYGYTLYFLKQSSSNQNIANKLGMLESDVIKAWEYWNEAGLIRIIDRKNFREFNIQFLKAPSPSPEITKEQKASISSDTKVEALETYIQGEVTTFEPIEPNKHSSELTKQNTSPIVKKIIQMAEKELGPLNEFKANIILGFHFDYGLPIEVIKELFQYCKTRRKLSISYIEKVAISWAKLKINSLEKLSLYQKEFGEKANLIFKIQSAIGIPRDGNYTKEEDEIYDRWTRQYGYTLDMIKLAASKAVQAGNKGNLHYIDGIIKNWYKHGVRIQADIEKAEKTIQQSFKKHQSSSAASKLSTSKVSTLKNFEEEQIDYDKIMRIHKKLTVKDLFE